MSIFPKKSLNFDKFFRDFCKVNWHKNVVFENKKVHDYRVLLTLNFIEIKKILRKNHGKNSTSLFLMSKTCFNEHIKNIRENWYTEKLA